jgi:hypothetical protein
MSIKITKDLAINMGIRLVAAYIVRYNRICQIGRKWMTKKTKKNNNSLKEIEEGKNRIGDYQRLPVPEETGSNYQTEEVKGETTG